MSHWRLRDTELPLDEGTLVMGIVNVTPDSFSDGGAHADTDAAVEHALRLVDEGAHILDVGGESTRPGATPVTTKEELARVLPVVEALVAAVDVPVSVDTMKPDVAEACLGAGAAIVNDVTGFRDPALRDVAVRHEAGVVVMHMQGEPRTMQKAPAYGDVVREVRDFLVGQARLLEDAGLHRDAIALDPGIGFGKTLAHNLDLIAHVDELAATGYPVLLGHSRKSFIGTLTGEGAAARRLEGSLAAAALAAAWGAEVLRVHDVGATVRALAVADALAAARGRDDR